MATKPTQPTELTVTVPENPDEARQVLVLAGSKDDAVRVLGELATIFATAQKQASETRKLHDMLLSLRNMMRKDCEDVKPLRQPRGSGSDDDVTEPTEAETPAVQ